MSAPFSAVGAFSAGTGLALAVLIGFGFGFVLERAGFGSSRRLAAQFYLYDMTVFKVMFTAIITAMVGLFVLARIGWVDLDLVYINPTHLWPQIVGGFLLGVGFIVSGYCPGTAIVAGASGKVDGMLAMAGVTGGILLFGVAYQPWLEAFHKSGDFGRVLLSDLFHVSPLFLALEITIIAGGAFVFAEWVERRFVRRAEPGRAPVQVRWMAPALAGSLAAIVAVAFLLPQAPAARIATRPPSEEISPLDLARHLVEGNADWTIVDLREASLVAKASIPGAVALPPEDLKTAEAWNDRFPPHRLIVLVDDGGGAAARLRVPVTHDAAVVTGGFPAWDREILTPATTGAGDDPLARERAGFVAYFTGAATAAPAAASAPRAIVGGGGKKAKPAGGCS